MRASKGIVSQTRGNSTHSTVEGGPGYFPTGYSTGGGYEIKLNPYVNNQSTDNFLYPGWEGNKIARYTSTKVKTDKHLRDTFYERFRPEPGVYASTKWGHFEEGNRGDSMSALHQTNGQEYQLPHDFLSAAGVLELQHDIAAAPHQWLAPIVELDHTEEQLQNYFEDISSKALADKVEILREEGYGEEEIANAISKAREADILRKFKNPTSAIRKSAHAFGDVQVPFFVQAQKNAVRYPSNVDMSFLRARGNRFGPTSRGHLPGDERPRLTEEVKSALLTARLKGPSAQGRTPARGRPGFSKVSESQRGVEPTILEPRRRQ